MESNKPVILFDGVCNLCNGFVDFLIKRDRGFFLFSSIQSEFGQKYMKEPVSIALVRGDRYWVESAAVVQIFINLPFPWPLVGLIWIIPRPLRDWGYRWVASHRYQWFGKRETCRLPTPEERSRFLP